MILLNNRKFAATEKEFINSLFESGGTCSGFYKPMKNRIRLFNPQKVEIGSVTCYGILAKCSILKDGKKWYSYGTVEEVGEFKSIIEESKQINSLLKEFKINRKY